ncbi:MAG TPA: dual specificity protein phosphatase [Herpetosiphonaceae bacterium]|nr:dual specificity protein phosphatase [Herpetosiphonaceae bacterium]
MHTIRPWLCVGSYRDSLDAGLLRANRIGALLHLESMVSHPGIAGLYLPVEDAAPLPADALREGMEFVAAARARDATLMIACAAGISRSVAFACAALVEQEGLDLLDAYRAIRAAHRQALPHHLLWESLCARYGQPADYARVVAIFCG